jgi:hypothetical protein
MWIKGLQATSVILVAVGTWLLAFGLKVRPGINQALEKELDLEKKGLVSPSAVRQRPAFFWVGLGLITAGALIALLITLR